MTRARKIKKKENRNPRRSNCKSLKPRRVNSAWLFDAMAKLKLDLHDIYNKGNDIDAALRDLIEEALAKRITLVEIIPGKGSGQLKKHVLRFLEQKEIKKLYHRIDKDNKNFGRLFVHFRFD